MFWPTSSPGWAVTDVPWLPARCTEPLRDDFDTDGDDLIRFAQLAWTTPETREPFQLHDWQAWLLRRMLERYPADWHDPELAGKLRYRQVVVSVARQQGKSVIGALLALYSLLWAEGANVIGVASSVDQANIIFRRGLLVINQNPALRRILSRATETRGIQSHDGRRSYNVKPAKESALQGIPASAVIYDELHLVQPQQWAAMVLGTSATEGTVFGITTAGDQDSELLLSLYEQGDAAIAGDSERFGFFCWEAPPAARLDDPDAIAAANPSVAEGHIPVARVLEDMRTIPKNEAIRYRLNRFVETRDDTWIEQADLHRAYSGADLPEGRLIFGVDRSHSWEYATVTAAVKTGDQIHSEIVATFNSPTKDSLLAFMLELAKLNPVAVFLESFMLKELAADLRQSGLTVYALGSAEICSASSTLFALLKQQRVTLRADPLLMLQAPHAIRKQKGDHWRLARPNGRTQIDALMATACAVYGASREHDIGPQIY